VFFFLLVLVVRVDNMMVIMHDNYGNNEEYFDKACTPMDWDGPEIAPTKEAFSGPLLTSLHSGIFHCDSRAFS